jgi:hypothetical protein
LCHDRRRTSGAGPILVPSDLDRGAVLIAPDDLSVDHQAKGAAFIEEGRPIDEQQNSPADRKKIAGFQEDSATADIESFGWFADPRNEYLGSRVDAVPLMLSALASNGSSSNVESGRHTPSFSWLLWSWQRGDLSTTGKLAVELLERKGQVYNRTLMP